MRRLVLLACLLGGLCATAAPGRAETLETPYLRLRFSAQVAAFDLLQVDLQGKGHYGPNLAAGEGLGLYVTSRPASGAWTNPYEGSPPEVELRDSSEGPMLLIRGLAHGPGVTETQQVTLARNAPEITLRRQLRVLESGSYLTLGQLRLALDPAVVAPAICFAGRQGVAVGHALRPGELIDPELALAGAVAKQPEATVVMSSQARLQSSVLFDAQGACATGLSIWDVGPAGQARRASAGEAYQHAITISFGRGAAAQCAPLKSAASSFDPAAEDFIFWCSHIGTTRPFASTPKGGERRLQSTAAVIDPRLPPTTIAAYEWCWLRDVAHGWKSGAYVAGPAMLRVMRDEIEAFAGRLNDAGWAPTNLGPRGEASYGNLDGMGWLIGMVYDYVSKTGDADFLQAMLPAMRRCAWAILSLQGPHGLPVVGPDGDTYPDLGFIKGEQTYLAAVCYDGLTKMAALCSLLGSREEADRWRVAADRIKSAANKDVGAGGLWDPARGVYVGWRAPDGIVYANEDSFANLIAIDSGMCDDPARVKAVFTRLNAMFQRYYLDGLCPTAHSVAPYPNGLNQWCPWIGGWDLLVRGVRRAPRTAEVLQRYLRDYEQCDYPFQEASGYRQVEPDVGNRGRVWDSWGLLAMIYGAHYGIAMRPANLRVWPQPLKAVAADGVRDFEWQGARVEIAIEGDGPEITDLVFMGSTWPSSVLPKMSGRARVIVKRGKTTPLLLLDASPEVELVGAARESATRLSIAVSVPCEGVTRYLVRCPEKTARVRVQTKEHAAGQVSYDPESRQAAITVSAPRAMRLHLTIEAEPLPQPAEPPSA